MAKKAKKKVVRRPWTKEDIRALKTLARRRISAARIAKQFKRTVPAIRQRAAILGVSLDSRAKRRKTAQGSYAYSRGLDGE
jgi:hypothetical protein